MPLITLYQSASGPAYNAAYFLGLRFEEEEGFQPHDSEWWVMHTTPVDGKTKTSIQYGTSRWLTRIWRSPAGVAYVSDAEGEIHVNPDLRASDSHARWTRHSFPCPIMGLWGLDDQSVYAWGSTPKVGFHVFRWDGKVWHDLPSPGFDVLDVHGAAPDLVYAVGVAGAVARFDGRAWSRLASPVNENLVSVFVASGDEQYATGHRGSLLEGSASGWGKVAQGPSTDWPLHAAVKWQGELWIAAGPFGLLKRAGTTSRLDAVKPKLRATALEGGEALVVTGDDMIAGTRDGKDFKAAAQGVLLSMRASKPLIDFT